MPTDLQLDYGAELAQQRIAERARHREHRAWQQSKRTGIAFMGARRVLRQAHTKRARSYEALGSPNPQFAAAGHRGAATEAVRGGLLGVLPRASKSVARQPPATLAGLP